MKSQNEKSKEKKKRKKQVVLVKIARYCITVIDAFNVTAVQRTNSDECALSAGD